MWIILCKGIKCRIDYLRIKPCHSVVSAYPIGNIALCGHDVYVYMYVIVCIKYTNFGYIEMDFFSKYIPCFPEYANKQS